MQRFFLVSILFLFCFTGLGNAETIQANCTELPDGKGVACLYGPFYKSSYSDAKNQCFIIESDDKFDVQCLPKDMNLSIKVPAASTIKIPSRTNNGNLVLSCLQGGQVSSMLHLSLKLTEMEVDTFKNQAVQNILQRNSKIRQTCILSFGTGVNIKTQKSTSWDCSAYFDNYNLSIEINAESVTNAAKDKKKNINDLMDQIRKKQPFPIYLSFDNSLNIGLSFDPSVISDFHITNFSSCLRAI